VILFGKETTLLNLLTFSASLYFIVPVFLWGLVYDKRWAFILALCLFFLSTHINAWLKEFFQIPLNPSLGLTHVYAFPSGHMQNSSVLWGIIAWAYKKPWLTFLTITILLVNGFAIYALGYHTPIEIIGGAYCAVLMLCVLSFFRFCNPYHRWAEKTSIKFIASL
jgi:membrane-associated phospholipid phosphatase